MDWPSDWELVYQERVFLDIFFIKAILPLPFHLKLPLPFHLKQRQEVVTLVASIASIASIARIVHIILKIKLAEHKPVHHFLSKWTTPR